MTSSGRSTVRQDVVLPADEVVGPAGDLGELRQRPQAVGGRVLGLQPVVELRLQSGDADLEELVEVRRRRWPGTAAARAAGWKGRAPLRARAR